MMENTVKQHFCLLFYLMLLELLSPWSHLVVASLLPEYINDDKKVDVDVYLDELSSVI